MLEKQRFLTIGEAAEFLHVSEISLRRWTNSGKLRCFRVGGRNERRFLMDDLLTFMPSEAQLEVMQTPALETQAQLSEIETEHETDYTERHISMFFRDAEEQWHMLCPYILDHLHAGAPVIYLQHGTSMEELMERLRTEGLPLDTLIARGLLRILPRAQSYLLPGRFEAQRMLDFLEMTIQVALETGHKRILMTGEMTSLQDAPGSEEMAHYEERLNPLVDKYPAVTIVCQYDLQRFNGATILDALLTHPSILVSKGRAPGFYGI